MSATGGEYRVGGFAVCGRADRGACRSGLNHSDVKWANGPLRPSREDERMTAMGMPLWASYDTVGHFVFIRVPGQR